MAELDTNQDRLAPRNFFSSSSVPLARRKSKDTAEDRGVGDTPTIHISHPARLRLKKKKAGQKKTQKWGPHLQEDFQWLRIVKSHWDNGQSKHRERPREKKSPHKFFHCFYILYIRSILCSKHIHFEAIWLLPTSPALSYLLKCFISLWRDCSPSFESCLGFVFGSGQPVLCMMYMPSAPKAPSLLRLWWRQHVAASIVPEMSPSPSHRQSLAEYSRVNP